MAVSSYELNGFVDRVTRAANGAPQEERGATLCVGNSLLGGGGGGDGDDDDGGCCGGGGGGGDSP